VVTGEALTNGYALGFTLCAAVLVIAALVAFGVLRRVETVAPAVQTLVPERD
jgi:hypothetical protein